MLTLLVDSQLVLQTLQISLQAPVLFLHLHFSILAIQLDSTSSFLGTVPRAWVTQEGGGREGRREGRSPAPSSPLSCDSSSCPGHLPLRKCQHRTGPLLVPSHQAKPRPAGPPATAPRPHALPALAPSPASFLGSSSKLTSPSNDSICCHLGIAASDPQLTNAIASSPQAPQLTPAKEPPTHPCPSNSPLPVQLYPAYESKSIRLLPSLAHTSPPLTSLLGLPHLVPS